MTRFSAQRIVFRSRKPGPKKNGPSRHPFRREKHTEQATNYPFQRIFQNKPPYGKDRQRYALYLTVFWFSPMCTLEKTVRKTVKLSGYRRVKTLDSLPILFLVQ
jgi:hypothetical protein